jgi:hypothetical protein
MVPLDPFKIREVREPTYSYKVSGNFEGTVGLEIQPPDGPRSYIRPRIRALVIRASLGFERLLYRGFEGARDNGGREIGLETEFN